MTPDKHQINRLGFEAWADNVMMNLFENMPANCTEITSDDGDVHVRVKLVASDAVCWVRAYVPGCGWKHHERTFKRY